MAGDQTILSASILGIAFAIVTGKSTGPCNEPSIRTSPVSMLVVAEFTPLHPDETPVPDCSSQLIELKTRLQRIKTRVQNFAVDFIIIKFCQKK